MTDSTNLKNYQCIDEYYETLKPLEFYKKL